MLRPLGPLSRSETVAFHEQRERRQGTFIDEQLATKGYRDVSEYFRSLLREAKDREDDARLETLLAEGLATSGDDIPLSREFWKDLKVEAMDLAKKYQGRKNSS